MEVSMIQHIALDEEVVEAEESVVRLSNGDDTGTFIVVFACPANNWIEDKCIEVDRNKKRIAGHGGALAVRMLLSSQHEKNLRCRF